MADSDPEPHRTVTQAEIARDLEALGLAAGDVVMLHSSLSSIGFVEGGAGAVIDAFLEVLGPDGTLCVPTIVHTSGVPRDVFSPEETPSDAGAITEALRQRPDALRSDHPTHSVAALGGRARELVSGHASAAGALSPWGRDAFGHGSPWDLIHELDAKYLFLGVDFQVCTLFHYAQTRFVERHQESYAEPIPWPVFDHRAMGQAVSDRTAVVKGRVGCANTLLTTAASVVRAVLAVLEDDKAAEGPVAPRSAFACWVRTTKHRALTLLGGMGRGPLDLPDWPRTKDRTSLCARALAIADATDAVAVVSLTLLALTRDDASIVRERVSESTGIPADHIMVACTHLHSGPDTLSASWAEDRSGIQAVADAAGRAAGVAMARREPVRLGTACRSLEGVSRLRRIRMSDGRTYTIRRAVPSTWRLEDKAEFVEPDGCLDTTLTVLRVEREDREPLGCLFHFTCHPIPDFFGYAADFLERVQPAPFVCLPLNGALGDVDTPFDRPFAGRLFADQVGPLGGTLAGAVVELLARADVADGGAVKANSRPVAIPVSDWVRRKRRDDPMPRIREAARHGAFETEMMAVRLGGMALLGIPGEASSAIGLSIRQMSPFEVTCPVGLVNDELAYMIPPESRARGGYEADPRFWGLCGDQAESILLTEARLCLDAIEEE